MCGIAGALGPHPAPLVLGRAMSDALSHRGPDGFGVEVLPGGAGVFAHRRLKIIDLSERARQPFVSDDGQVLVVFNGEIYNFRALRAGLEPGHAFRSSSDTEVLLAQYLRHGTAGLEALDGMFAFALYDARHRRLVLMRDRLGKKPLYHATLPDGTFLFASEIKALRAHPGFTAALAAEHLPELLTFGYVGTPRSLFRGVSKLPPATMFVLEGDRATTRTYWSLEERTREPLSLDLPSAMREVRRALSAAVDKRLVSDVPLGAFLSGGVDSSVVVAEMARRSPGRVRTFAVGFDDDKSFDETRYAREVAARFDTDHTEIRVGALPTDRFEALLEHHDEPYGDSSALALYAVSAATKPHVTVVLTGDGGDEVFSGYTRFRGGLLAGYVPPALQHAVRSALVRVPEPKGYKNPIALLRRFVDHADRSEDERLLAFNSYFVGRELAGLLRPEVAGPGFDPWRVMAAQLQVLEDARRRGKHRLDQILLHNLKTYLLDDLLIKADRMTMAAGLEGRSPFLDTDLLELVFRLPVWTRMRYGQLKWLLREAYRDTLPPIVLDRRKHGFGVPVGRWWNGALSGMVRDLLLAPGARVHELFEPRALSSIVDEHARGRRDHGQRIFLLLQVELWLRGLAGKQALRASA